MPYRQKKGKEKEKKSEKENEKKAERSTVKMYYWNVALSEHCEDVPLEHRGMWLNTTGTPRNVPLEHHGSVHWNTEEVCEVAPFTQCHCWDEEAAQFRQERELQKVASQQIVRQPLVVAGSRGVIQEPLPAGFVQKIDTSVTAAKQSRATGSRGVISEGQDRLETTG